MGVGTKRTIKTPHGNHNALTLIQEETVKMGNRCLSLIGSPVGEPEENLQSSKWSDGQGWDSLCPTPKYSSITQKVPRPMECLTEFLYTYYSHNITEDTPPDTQFPQSLCIPEQPSSF